MGPGSYVTSTALYYNKPKRSLSARMLLMILAALVIIGLIVIIAVFSGRNNISTEAQHLSAQLTNLSTISANASGKLSDGNLAKINAETGLIADGAATGIKTIIPKKLDKKIIASEADATSTQKLADAALAGTYNSAYKDVLKQKLESVTAAISATYAKTKSQALRDSLNQDYNDFETLLTNLNKLN